MSSVERKGASNLDHEVTELLDKGGAVSFDSALQVVLKHFDCVAGTLHGLDEGSWQLTLKAQRGLPPPLVDKIRRIPVGKGLAGLLIPA